MRYVIATLLFLGACGGVGKGNKVLLVTSTAEFDGNRTRVEVLVSRDGAPLNDQQAIVQVSVGDDGPLQSLSSGGGDKFQLDIDGYARSLTLEINSGEDNLEASLDGPSAVIFSSPTQGQIFNISAGENVFVAWDGADNDNANRVSVKIKDFETTLENDPGELEVPFTEVAPDANKIELTRTNEAALDGGADGSFFQISAKQTADLIVQ